MEFSEVLNTRRSVRRFRQEPIEDTLLLALVDAATKAPSAGNSQPLRYVVIREKTLLAKVFALTAWGGHVRPARDPKLGSTSPVAFIAVCSKNMGDDTPAPAALVDAGAAIQNILLQATNFGLGSCWLGAFDKSKLNRLLEFNDLTVTYLVALGYPAETPSLYRIHPGESTKYSLNESDIIQVPKYAPGDVTTFC